MTAHLKGEALAKRVLAAHWDGTLPVDIAYLCAACGLPAFWMPERMEGHIADIQVREGKARLYLAKDEPLVRQRYAAAHALGAFLSDPNRSRTFNLADYSATALTVENAFAKALLMPKQAMDLAIQARGNGPDAIGSAASLMEVSEVALAARLNQLGIL